jgi:hypothetical protein
MKDSGNNPEKAAAGRFAAIVGKDEGVPRKMTEAPLRGFHTFAKVI